MKFLGFTMSFLSLTIEGAEPLGPFHQPAVVRAILSERVCADSFLLPMT